MERYQSYFRKLDNVFNRKQQAAVMADQKINFLLISNFTYDLIYDFFCLSIFRVATSLSIFLRILSSLTQQRKQIKSNYTFL